MPSYKDPRSGITRGWDAGEDGWGAAVNESLQQIAYVGTHPLVKGQLSTPPASPVLGDAYIVGSSPTGAWSTFTETHIAFYGRRKNNYALSAWQSFTPLEGWVFYRSDTDQLIAYSGTAWGNIGSSTYKGAWSAGIYAVGDITRHANNFYIAKTARVASNTSNPAADAEWLLLTAAGSATGNYKGAWSAGTYAVGDVVSYLGNFYVARTARATTDTSNPTLDAEWLILTAAGSNNDNYRGDWSADAYSIGNIVRYSNRFFIARASRSATDTTVPTMDNNWLDITAPSSGTSYKGVWSAGVYGIGDIVLFQSRYYFCTQARTAAHTLTPGQALSGWSSLIYNAQLDPVAETTTFSDALRFTIGTGQNRTEYITGANLKAGIAGNYRGTWVALTAYALGDVVSYGTSFFIARSARPTSSSTVPTSDAEWLDIASSGNTIYKGTYAGGTAYATGDLVVRGGAFFLARVNNTDANFRPDRWLQLGTSTAVSAEHLRVTNNVIIKTLNTASTTVLPAGSDAAYAGTIQSGIIHGGMFGPRSGGLLNLPTGTNKFWRYVTDVGNVYFTDLTVAGANTSNYRVAHAMVGDEDRGLVFGGEDSTGTLNTMTSYVRSGSTATLATLAVSTAGANGTPARTLHTMVGNRFNGMIFGGIVNNVATNDFVYYEASENVVTYYNMTINGTIAARRNHVMVGNADEGIIYGGDWTNTFSDFVYYRRSGTSVTVTTLTRLGYNLAGRTEAMMVGDVNSGILFGGSDGSVRDTFVAYRRDSDSIILTLQTNVGSIRMLEGSIMIGDAAAGLVWCGDDPTDARDTLYTYDRRISTAHYKGDWSANTSYAVGDLISYQNNFYLCKTANSDSTFTPSKWVALEDTEIYKGIYDATVAYNKGDIVEFGNKFYQAKQSHTARLFDPTIWDQLTPETPAAQRLRLSNTATIKTLTKTGTIAKRDEGGIAGNSRRGIIYGGNDDYGTDTSAAAQNNWNEYVVDAGRVYVRQLTTTGATMVARYGHRMVGDDIEGLVFGGIAVDTFFSTDKVYYYVRVLSNGQPTNQLQLTETTVASGSFGTRALHGVTGDSTRGMIFGGAGTGGANRNDFRYYTRSGTAMTYTTMTVTGTIPAMSRFGMVGNADIGLIFNTNAFYLWERTGASTVRVTTLTKSGATVTNRSDVVMVGDHNTGIISTGLAVAPEEAAVLTSTIAYRREGTTIYLTEQTLSGALTGRREAMGVGDSTGMIIYGGDNESAVLDDFVSIDRWESGIESSVNDITNSTINNTVSPTNVSTVTATALTKTGSIAARWGHAHVGDETAGLIACGVSAAGNNPSPSSTLGDFVKYVVNSAGTGVTLTTLTKAGTTMPGNLMKPLMWGTPTAGFFGGGLRAQTGNANRWDRDFKMWSYVANDSTITFTAINNKHHSTVTAPMFSNARAGSLLSAGSIFADTSGNLRIGGNTSVVTASGNNAAFASYIPPESIQPAVGFDGIHGAVVESSGRYVAFYGPRRNVSNTAQAEYTGHYDGCENVALLSAPSQYTLIATNLERVPTRAVAGDDMTGVLFGGYSEGAFVEAGRTGNSNNNFKFYSRSGTTLSHNNLTLTGTVTPRHQCTMKGSASSGLIFGGVNRKTGGVGAGTTVLGDFVKYTTNAVPPFSGLTTAFKQITSTATTTSDYYTVSFIDDRGTLSPSLGDSITIRGSDIPGTAASAARVVIGASTGQHIEFYRAGSGHILARRGSGINRFNTVRVIKHA